MAGKRAFLSSSFSSIFVLLVVFFHLVTMASSDSSEAETLIKFKESLKNAGALSNWDASKPPCDGWNGVMCEKGRVWGLKLENMGLSGIIDVESLSKLTGLRTISFMNNNFDGPMPSLSSLGVLKTIYLSGNKFSGEIPSSTFHSMMSLKKLHLANNAFSGSIPTTLASLPKLMELRLENNQFAGEIPSFQDKTLRDFNVSNNKLVGKIPEALETIDASSFSGNSDLCGAPLEPCSTKKHQPLLTIIIVAILMAVALAALLAVIIILSRCKKPSQKQDMGKNKPTTTAASCQPQDTVGDLNKMERGHVFSSPDMGKKPGVRLTFLRDGGDRFEMADLLKASAEVLGNGSCGSTFKAALNNGKVMAVKRYKQMNKVSREEFNEHMRRLGRLNHENVLPLVAFYFRKEEKLLVAEFMQNGSLATQLHENKSRGLPTPDWLTRLNIIKGVSKGLLYLYNELPSFTAQHGHLKSSNVLLDASFKPLLTDYSLIPIINQEHAQTSMISYRSPEQKSSGRISKKSDIWSLGILILEILTGKSPWEGEADLAGWVETEVKNGGADVFDKDMAVGQYSHGEMVKLLNIGLSCCQVDPDMRPEIMEVVDKVEEVQEKDVDDDFYSSYASEGDMRSSRGLSRGLSGDFKTINI